MSSIPKISEDAISTKDASNVLGVSEQRVRTLLRSGALVGRQLGKHWLTTLSAVNAYRQEGGTLPPKDRVRTSTVLPQIKALSFFSGAMGLDLGLERSGIDVLLACEVDKACRRTISANRPDIGLLGDVWKYSALDFKKAAGLKEDDDVDVMVGGPPCQAFSTAGARRGFEDARGNALLRYVELILEIKPKYAVIENVRGLLSAPMIHTPHAERDEDWIPSAEGVSGGALLYIIEKLRSAGYGVTFNLYNSANFGVPQSRERVIILCSRNGDELPHLMPTHSTESSYDLPAWRTLRDAFAGLNPSIGDHEDFPPERIRFYRMLKAGQYWKHLPKELHREALGKSLDSGGGKTGFFRRLDWDKPSCTLVTSPTMPATDICHPVEDRPISVQEYMRIQEFPDSWILCGSLQDRYRQIGNAVPVGLGAAVGRAILGHMSGVQLTPPVGFRFSRYKETDENSWEIKVRKAIDSQKINGPKKSRLKDKKNESQIPLFSE